jgi:hypothetical protein
MDKITKQMIISIGSTYSVVHDNLQFHKMCARWIPKRLTNEHKCMHLDICSCHLTCYCKEGEKFLQWIATDDEAWTDHYQPETNRKGMQ